MQNVWFFSFLFHFCFSAGLELRCYGWVTCQSKRQNQCWLGGMALSERVECRENKRGWLQSRPVLPQKGQFNSWDLIRPCHTAAILSRETKKALFYHAKPRPNGFHCEAWRGKTKLFWSPGTIWPPCDKGE